MSGEKSTSIDFFFFFFCQIRKIEGEGLQLSKLQLRFFMLPQVESKLVSSPDHLYKQGL